MSPALIRLHNLKLGEPSFFASGAETMHVQFMHPRSGGSDGGVQENTIIFIVVGAACLFVILTGFYLVSRRAASNAAPNDPCPYPQHSPIAHPPCPRRERNMSKYWKIWKIWRHTSTEHPAAPEVPTVQVSFTATSPSIPPRAMTYPLIIPRPPQARRVTSLSVTTSFSHSHITQEALNEFRVSAYDLDGDLETEMLNSARDDFWPGHVLAVEEGCGDVARIDEIMEAGGNATHVIDGSVQDHAAHTHWNGGGYEIQNSDACQNMVSESEGDLVETVEVGKVATGREALQ